ncbi:MAG: hypothetical protein K9G62_08310 [Alphaproteobacteria bacterium]|nr:hypothetical protein [Alphaproteobacteria bacterium]
MLWLLLLPLLELLFLSELDELLPELLPRWELELFWFLPFMTVSFWLVATAVSNDQESRLFRIIFRRSSPPRPSGTNTPPAPAVQAKNQALPWEITGVDRLACVSFLL